MKFINIKKTNHDFLLLNILLIILTNKSLQYKATRLNHKKGSDNSKYVKLKIDGFDISINKNIYEKYNKEYFKKIDYYYKNIENVCKHNPVLNNKDFLAELDKIKFDRSKNSIFKDNHNKNKTNESLLCNNINSYYNILEKVFTEDKNIKMIINSMFKNLEKLKNYSNENLNEKKTDIKILISDFYFDVLIIVKNIEHDCPYSNVFKFKSMFLNLVRCGFYYVLEYDKPTFNNTFETFKSITNDNQLFKLFFS